MITANVSAYLYLEQLHEYKTITRKGVTTQRKQPRYDLVQIAGFYQELDRLKNHKGQLFFNLIPSDKNDARKQGGTTPEYYLQCTPSKSKSINFSGLRFLHLDRNNEIYASGEPSGREILTGGVKNPLYDCRNDGFLFQFSADMECLEILILNNGRQLIDAYRKQLSVGGFDDILHRLREQAKEVFPL